MQPSGAYNYLQQSQRRKKIMSSLHQPMTAKQIAHHTELSIDTCSYVLGELVTYKLVVCLNNQSRRSRLYWLTDRGKECQQKLFIDSDLPTPIHDFPNVDWNLYGWACFSHHSAIIRAMYGSMQPITIKHKARSRNPLIRMSANNVRDVIRLFLDRGIVQPIKVKRKAHLHYVLTDSGKQFQTLLNRAHDRSHLFKSNTQKGFDSDA